MLADRTRLAMTIDEQLSFGLADDLAIKSMHFGDALLDEASQTDDGDDPVLRLETDFALMTGVIEQLVEELGGEATPAAPAP